MAAAPLEQVHAIVCLDAIFVKIREDGAVSNQAVHLVINVDCTGCKQMLGLWIEQTDGAGFWLSVPKELNKRGVADILSAVTDDHHWIRCDALVSSGRPAHQHCQSRTVPPRLAGTPRGQFIVAVGRHQHSVR